MTSARGNTWNVPSSKIAMGGDLNFLGTGGGGAISNIAVVGGVPVPDIQDLIANSPDLDLSKMAADANPELAAAVSNTTAAATSTLNDKMSKYKIPAAIPQKWVIPSTPGHQLRNNYGAPDFEHEDNIRAAAAEIKRKSTLAATRWKLAVRVTLDRYVLQLIQTESMGLKWDPSQKTNLFPYAAVNSAILRKMKQELMVADLARNYLSIPEKDRTYKQMEMMDGIMKKMQPFSKYHKVSEEI